MLKVVAITGAGLSVESGIRPYRGPTGVYTELEEKYGMPAEELLTFHTFWKNPDLFWTYWKDMATEVGSVEPNDAHKALVRISDKTTFLEVTQNVDGLSRKAGLLDSELIELHGTAYAYRCARCGIAHSVVVHAAMETPRCTRCGKPEQAPIRPNIVMFGETIKTEHYKRSFLAAKNADVLLLIGTSLQFGYLTDFIDAAMTNNAVVVQIDPQAESSAFVDVILPMTASAGIALVDAAIDRDMETREQFKARLMESATK